MERNRYGEIAEYEQGDTCSKRLVTELVKGKLEP